MSLSGWLLTAIFVFGGLAVLATAAYPVVSAREDKERLARDAKTILLPEIEENKNLVASMQTSLTPNAILTRMLETAAWQAISNGGLLIGLNSDQINRLLRIYSLVFQVNALVAKLLDLRTGMSYSLNQAPQIRQIIFDELQGKLSELQKAFADVKSE